MEPEVAPWLSKLLKEHSRHTPVVHPHLPRRLQPKRQNRSGARHLRLRHRRLSKNRTHSNPDDASESMGAVTTLGKLAKLTSPGNSALGQSETGPATAPGKPVMRVPESTPGPKQLYLLTQYMAFDKFSGQEREELLEVMVQEWLRGDRSDDIWDHVATYCESSYLLDRVTSAVRFPNRLSTAICCDILQMMARRDTTYRRVFNLIKSGLYAAIYRDYSPRKGSFLHMNPYFERGVGAVDDAGGRDGGRTSRTRSGQSRERRFVHTLREMTPEMLAEIIRSEVGSQYADRLAEVLSEGTQ